jgi:putative ubiquitin-RnfH superfamily antitoxin RatB of RatAB toxin-antitoxin module
MAPADAAAGSIRVELAFSPRAGEVQRIALTLPEGTTIAQALEHSGLALPADLRVGIWGRLREFADTLRDRDRLELYRPLTVDPKEARRLRYRSHREAKKP